MASILITTPAANNAAFPATVSGSYTVAGGGGGEATAAATALLGVAITVTLTREDNNSSSDHDATDDGGGAWHLDKPGGLAAVKYTIEAKMTAPATANFARTGIQN